MFLLNVGWDSPIFHKETFDTKVLQTGHTDGRINWHKCLNSNGLLLGPNEYMNKQ